MQTINEEILQEALKMLKAVDPDGDKVQDMANVIGTAISGLPTIVVMVAALTVIETVIEIPYPQKIMRTPDSQAQKTINFLYHAAIGLLTGAAMEAGAFDDMIAQMEKFETAQRDKSKDN